MVGERRSPGIPFQRTSRLEASVEAHTKSLSAEKFGVPKSELSEDMTCVRLAEDCS